MAPPRRSNETLDNREALAGAYGAARSIADLAAQIGVSTSTVQRALVRHGIDRLPRNRNRRPKTAARLDDAAWLARTYANRTAVDIANELGTTARTVYAAMAHHGIPRRTPTATVAVRHPELGDTDWLCRAVESEASGAAAAHVGVSPGTLTNAYRRAGLDPSSTPLLFARGRRKPRPDADELASAWASEDSFRGVANRYGISHATAAVWLAEVGIFAGTTPAVSRTELVSAIDMGWPMARIAERHGVAINTVRIELHRHGLFEAHRQRHRRPARDA